MCKNKLEIHITPFIPALSHAYNLQGTIKLDNELIKPKEKSFYYVFLSNSNLSMDFDTIFFIIYGNLFWQMFLLLHISSSFY